MASRSPRAEQPATRALVAKHSPATRAAHQPAARGAKQRTRAAQELHAHYDVALNTICRGLSMFDDSQRLIFCNRSYSETYRLPASLTRPGTSLVDILQWHLMAENGSVTSRDLENINSWLEDHSTQLRTNTPWSHTQQLNDGRTILVSYYPIKDGGWVDVQEDITERKRAQERIDWLARHDTLTELGNRHFFSEYLDQLLNTPRKRPFTIFWIDLDHFKSVNDTLGHPVGDALLKSVGARLIASTRRSDFVARLGGDEFALIHDGPCTSKQAKVMAERLIASISEPHFVYGNAVRIAASIGIVHAPQHGRSAEELLKNVDKALYAAKAAGRGVGAVFNATKMAVSDGKELTEQDLKNALDHNQFELFYQAIVSSDDHAVQGVEALMRWRHPERGMISPGEFIPLAERTELIIPMGAWALHKACHDATTMPAHIKMTVNVSARQFVHGDLFKATSDALASSGLRPERLELEITETVVLRDDPKTLDTLHKLRALGVGITLDDFGTAFASLSYLRSFPFDKIKIDRCFVKDLPGKKDSVVIIEMLANLARRLGIRTVAEGVETCQQLDSVTLAGCDQIQGFLFSTPVPVGDLLAKIAAGYVLPKSAAAA